MRRFDRRSASRSLLPRFGAVERTAVGLVGALTAAHFLFLYAQQSVPSPSGALPPMAFMATLGALGFLFVVALGFVRLCARRSVRHLRKLDEKTPLELVVGRLLGEPILLGLGIQGGALLIGTAIRPMLEAWTEASLGFAYTPGALAMLVAAPLGVALLTGGYSVAYLVLTASYSDGSARHRSPKINFSAMRTGFVGLQTVLVMAMLLGIGGAFQQQIALPNAGTHADADLFALQVRGDWTEPPVTATQQKDAAPTDCRSRSSRSNSFTSEVVQHVSALSLPPLVDSLVTLTVSLAGDSPSSCPAPRATPELPSPTPSRTPESSPTPSNCSGSSVRM